MTIPAKKTSKSDKKDLNFLDRHDTLLKIILSGAAEEEPIRGSRGY